jgi:predicted RNA-binding protein associated with RNAse of E/G family
MWSEGDVVCLRQTWRGRVWRANAWRVVKDGRDLRVLFAPIGAEAYFSGQPVPCDEWTLERSPFTANILMLVEPRRSYCTLLEWDASWTFVEWYVNFERPQQPFPLGFEYVDRALDLSCYPDGRWEILDEDELEDALRRGVLTEEDAAAARADAARLVEKWPFPTGWEDWRPDPDREPPALPAGWDVVG